MHVTVAICTWNRAHLLRKTLERMTEVTHPEPGTWDLVVVDNNCTDDTADVAASFAGRLPLRHIVERAQGLSNARNLALSTAQGTHILFTDDDVLVADGWLPAFVRGITRHPEAGGLGGPILPWFEVQPDPLLMDAFPMLARGFCGIDDERPEGALAEGLEVFGANMGFRLDAVRGLQFDPNLGASTTVGREGEEVEFSARLRERGADLVWLPDMRVRHYVDPTRMTLDYLCAYYEGRGRTAVRREGVPGGTRVLGMPRWLLRQWLGRAGRVVRERALGSRLAYLRSLREERYARGMLKECVAMDRDRS